MRRQRPTMVGCKTDWQLDGRPKGLKSLSFDVVEGKETLSCMCFVENQVMLYLKRIKFNSFELILAKLILDFRLNGSK